jgi:hypothetical protein
MFELKKYKIVKEFNGYRKGLVVSFNGKDAEKYAEFITSTEKAAPVVAAPVEEEKAAPKKRKYVRKGKK